MSGDYSRLIFDSKKHYSAVRMQQGRVLLDSDWNSQFAIYQDRLHKQTIDVVGKTGVPVHSNGFQLSRHSNAELSISQGRIYVNGLLCEIDNRVTFKINDGGILIPSEESSEGPSGEHLLPYGRIDTAMQEGDYLIYLEAWQREITYLDDPHIREKALGDPDTTTRLQTTWQLKAVSIDNGTLCDTIEIPFDKVGIRTTGTMEAKTVSADSASDPCSFNQTGGFRRLENQLYRIEIQKGGNLTEATFKWSRENASVSSNVLEIDGSVVKVNSLGRDEFLGFSEGDWVEFKNHDLSLNRTVNNLFQIEQITKSTMEVKVSGTLPDLDPRGLKMVRWDQSSKEIQLSSDAISIEDGIEVNFSEGTYIAGDYWLIPARTIDSSIEWPSEERKLPMGIKVSFAKIGLITIEDGKIQSVSDCRKLFPPLTELPTGGNGCSTYHVSPEPGWERVFDKIKTGEDAKICFAVGTYELKKTLFIENKGHLLITGCGQGTIIKAKGLKVAFAFNKCNSLDISHMTLFTDKVKALDQLTAVNRKGTLTVVNTSSLSIDKLHITCGHSTKPLASCITYYNDHSTPGSINIKNCMLRVGFYQHGIVIINSKRTLVENNVIKVMPKPSKHKISERIKTDQRTRNSLLDVMMSNFSADHNSFTNQSIKFGDQSVSFKTNPDLRKNTFWNNLIKNNPPSNAVKTTNDLKNHLRAVTLKLVLDNDKSIPLIHEFIASMNEEDPSFGFQGIVIGGSISTEVQISRNRIENFLQGIHVGLSHSHESGEEYDVLNSVRIESNFIRNTLTILNNYSRHGIFVGNCKKLSIDKNELDLNRMSRADKTPIDAIKVWGFLGRKGTITDNYVYSSTRPENSYNTGIKVINLEQTEDVAYWNISWNSLVAGKKISLPPNFYNKYLDTNN